MKNRLVGLEAAMAVARARNFRVAAVELGLSRSALSHAVAALEQEMGVRLFHRTTRSVSLTEAGEEFIAEISPAIGAVRAAMAKAGSRQESPSGRLRINSSVGAARRILTPIIADYLTRYPSMTVDIVTDGHKIDIVRDGFDAGIRLLTSVPQDMLAVPFGGDLRFAVVGSPAYFATRARPVLPDDLKDHACIRSRSPSRTAPGWVFQRDDDVQVFDGAGRLILDDPALMLEAARGGIGLAYLSEWDIHPYLEAGMLIRVLDDWTPPSPGLALYYPGRRHLPAGLRALVDMLRERREGCRVWL